MKKILNLSIALMLLGMLGTGCLKDNLVEEGLAGPKISESPNLIELMGTIQATSSFNSSYAISLNSSEKDTTFDVAFVRLASQGPASEDIQVQLELVPSLLTAYNDSNHTHLVPPPANAYTLSNNLVVTIPKGQREGTLKMTTRPSAIISGEFGLGFRVKSVSNTGYLVSGNFNNAVAIIGVKNKYDGVYSAKIATQGWAAYTIMDNPALMAYPSNPNFELITSGANSVTINNPTSGFGNLQPALTATGSATGFGATTPQYTFNATTNEVTAVTNTTADDGRGRTLKLDASRPGSKFDPATKTITIHYVMTQNGRPDQKITMEYTYVGPR